MLTSKHTYDTVTTTRYDSTTQKPKCIVEYNKGKAYIDISEQIKSYRTSLMRGVKWYQNFAVEILIGTKLTNVLCLYKKLKNPDISITNFTEEVIKELTES